MTEILLKVTNKSKDALHLIGTPSLAEMAVVMLKTALRFAKSIHFTVLSSVNEIWYRLLKTVNFTRVITAKHKLNNVYER